MAWIILLEDFYVLFRLHCLSCLFECSSCCCLPGKRCSVISSTTIPICWLPENLTLFDICARDILLLSLLCCLCLCVCVSIKCRKFSILWGRVCVCLIFVCCRAGVGRCLLPELFVCLSGGCTGRARPPLAEGELSVVLLLFGRHRLSLLARRCAPPPVLLI